MHSVAAVVVYMHSVAAVVVYMHSVAAVVVYIHSVAAVVVLYAQCHCNGFICTVSLQWLFS